MIKLAYRLYVSYGEHLVLVSTWAGLLRRRKPLEKNSKNLSVKILFVFAALRPSAAHVGINTSYRCSKTYIIHAIR